jgi:hypothetical protein
VGPAGYGRRVSLTRPVRVEAVIERPPAPPWIGELPFPERVDYWPGTLLDWRWVDKTARLWVGLVRYQRDGLTYEHAVSGELLTVVRMLAWSGPGALACSGPTF